MDNPTVGPVPEYILQANSRSLQSSFIDSDPAEAYWRNPLATDVRYWGNWMLEKAREELAEFYPPDLDGSVPVAYLWSRTIPCPSCHAEMPLIRQYWLARKSNKRVALRPVIDRENHRVDFEVVEGPRTSRATQRRPPQAVVTPSAWCVGQVVESSSGTTDGHARHHVRNPYFGSSV